MPQVALPDLGGDVVHDDTLVAFLVRQTLLEKEEEKEEGGGGGEEGAAGAGEGCEEGVA